MDCAYARNLIDQKFQQTAEVFHNFPLLQLIVLGYHGLKTLHQSPSCQNKTWQTAFDSKWSFLDNFYNYMVVPNLLNLQPLFWFPRLIFFSRSPQFQHDLFPGGIKLKSYNCWGGFRWKRLCFDTSLEFRIVLVFHKVPITLVHPKIKTVSLLLDSTYFVMVATATVLPVGKWPRREQLFPLFACLVWNPFSPESLRNCSTLKPLVFQFRVSP